MKAQKKSVTSWDVSFFKDFVALRNRLYASHPDFISEDVSDLELYLGNGSYFTNKMDWTAVLIEGAGRYLLSMSPSAESLYLGYFECDGNEESLRQSIWAHIAAYKQKYPQLKNVIGPIQGTLFAGYRFREPTAEARFLGESLHRDNYPELWKKWGFQVGEYWDSYNFEPQVGYDFFKAVEQKLGDFWKDPKITTRPLDLKNWDKEIEEVFEITMEAYDLTGTNDEIDFAIFKNISEKMKPLLKPRHVKMLEYDGKVVAFTICYPDIQESIRSYNRRKSFCPAWLNKLLLFASIQFRKHPLLLVYIAKRKDCPIKWAMAKIASAMITGVSPKDYPLVISALNAESSGSRASLPDRKTLHSRHFLMTLALT